MTDRHTTTPLVVDQLTLPFPADLQVEVVRSARRRKTVSAREVDGVVRVSIPSWMSKAEEAHWAERMLERFRRRAVEETVDLVARTNTLAARYDLPRPARIRWVDNQQDRWASCTPADGAIRVSSRLLDVPRWVLDYVLVHELAHLVEPGHGPAFWALVNRYPRTERARGFLMAKGYEADEG